MTPTTSRRALLLLAALALGSAASPQTQDSVSPTQLPTVPATDADVFRLHGVVRDSRTGKPIARALVRALGETLATMTDREGRFAMGIRLTTPSTGVNPVRKVMQSQHVLFLGLTVRKPGYLQRGQFPQTVAIGALANDLDLELTPESVIQGHIAASGDDHPDGVRVSLLSRHVQNGLPVWGQTRSAAANSRGEYRFGELAPGEYRLRTEEWSDPPAEPLFGDKPGLRYPSVFHPAASTASSGPSLHVEAGDTLQANLTLHAEMYYPVHIPVVFPSGNQDLQVRVLRAGADAGFLFSYDARKRTAVGMLPDGVYEAALEGSLPEGAVAAATTLLTVSGSPVDAPPVTLLPVPAIPVVVHRELTHDQPTPQAAPGNDRRPPLVVILQPEEPNRSSLVLDPGKADRDKLTLERAVPGTYRLEANAAGGYIAAATSGGTDLLHQPLVVAPGASPAPIEITVRDDAATLRGTIAPEALPGANTMGPIYIACLPSEPTGQRLPQSVARPDGEFRVNNVPPGSYRVFASRQPFDSLEYRSESFLQRNGDKGFSVTLAPGGASTVTLTAILDEEP